MAIIKVENLIKTYKTIEKEKGFIGYIKNLFFPKYKEFKAVDNISFTINEGRILWFVLEII